MAKNFEIQLKFTTGKTAQKLIKHLNNLAKAQDKVAKTQKKFNNDAAKAAKHVQILTQREQKHVVVMKKQQKQMQILNNRIKQQNVRLATLQGKLKVATVAQNRMRISTAGLQRVVGSLRNKILLFTFAFGGAITAVKGFVRSSSEFEAVKVRLNAMFGSVEKGTKAFNTFNKIAATTPFTLQDVVEGGAALKAFGADAEALIKPTADLAAFMGTTATEAASALGRAFAGGAGAADILRERGILQLVRDFKGIDDLTKLSLPEFRQAIEDTLLDPASGIAGSTDKLAKTMVGLVSNLSDAFTRMGAAIGDLVDFRGIITKLTGGFSRLAEHFKQMSETPFDTTIRQLKEMGVDTKALELSQANLNKLRMEDSGIAHDLVKSQEDLASKLENRKLILSEIASVQQTMLENGHSEASIRERLDVLAGQALLAASSGNQKKQNEITLEKNLLEAKLVQVDNLKNIKKQIDEQIAAGKLTVEQALEYKLLLEQIESLQKTSNEDKEKELDLTVKIFELTKAQQTLMDEAEALRLQTKEEIFSKHFDKVFSIAQKSIDAQKEAELSALRDTDKFRNASAEEREDMEKDALKKLQKKQNLVFKLNQANEIVKTIMSSIETASNIKDMRDELVALATALGASGNVLGAKKASAGAAALTAQRGAVIASGAAQAGLIAGQKPPAFARGGSFTTQGEQFIKVGDNSGGRERVDITPLSSPDFGDAGGGSSINVNIMGNVIGTQEFVRDNLLPEIENTIKRNLA
jgi:hypothetical protein|tara:strand:+ start:1458 stop:3719 length:2262 start_codon:yes stop_codon:yes gene_type:complete